MRMKRKMMKKKMRKMMKMMNLMTANQNQIVIQNQIQKDQKKKMMMIKTKMNQIVILKERKLQ
uniref:Alternative protein BAZ2B n=1 Tax=Homo sapiens TaxID=9606 RepID=L8EAN3_HUMAN|nr:alternative protein BAZ2B [Homo sapiens]